MPGSDERAWVYRADIDGLRALAVVAVVLSHLRIEWMGGGYVGVDMFFVVSGYVVFGDLLRRAETGETAAFAFYLRRVRRLLPNLVAMSIFVLAAGALLFLPNDYLRLPGRIAAAVLGFSNWLFAYQSGYFEPASEWNPLLHAWTLSVEFQFYLVVPLLVLAAARSGIGSLRLIATGVALASFGYALLTRDAESAYHFYDTGARAWEFLLGILLHLWRQPRFAPALANVLAGTALATLAACFVMLRRDDAFPDLRALLPTLSTAVLIAVLPSAPRLRAVFETRPMVATGRASYSIYIWHWPLIVFTAYAWPDFEHRPLIVGLVAALIFAVSFAMYRLVEVPMRSRSVVPVRRFWAVMATTGLALAVLCAGVAATKGWPSRFTQRELTLANEEMQMSPRRRACHRSSMEIPVEKSCVFGASVRPTVAIWSDSHGVELGEAMSDALANEGMSAALLSFSSCPPRRPERTSSLCGEFNLRVLQWLLAHREIETVVIAGALDTRRHRSNPAWASEFTAGAKSLLAAGKRLVVVYPVPEQPFHVVRAMVLSERFGLDYRDARTLREDYLRRNEWVFSTYDSLGGDGVSRVYPHETLCPGQRCEVSRDGAPLYFDDNHLTMRGARLLASEVIAPLVSAGG